MKAHTVRKLAGVLVVGAGLYALAGLLIAPVLIAHRLTDALEQQTGLDVATGRVRFSPFSLTATIFDLTVGEPETMPSAHVARITTQFSLRQLFDRTWRSRQLTLLEPRFSLALAPGSVDALTGRLSSLTDVALRQVDIVNGALDINAGEQNSLHFAAINMTLRDFGSGASHRGQFNLDAIADDAGTMTASGTLALAPAGLNAAIKMTDIDISKFSLPLSPETGLALSSATIGADGQLRLHDKQLTIDADIDLQRVAISEIATGLDVFDAKELSARAVTIRGATSPATISAQLLRIAGPHVNVQRMADGDVNAHDGLHALVFGRNGVLESITRLELTGGRLGFTDYTVEPPVEFAAAGLYGNFEQAGPGAPAALKVGGRLIPGNTTRLVANWQRRDTGLSGAWQLTTDEFDIKRLSPYLLSETGFAASAGRLSMNVDVLVNDNHYVASSVVDIQGLQLQQPDPVDAAAAWPLPLAVAILEDNEQRIHINVAVPTGQIAGNLTLPAIVREVFRDYVNDISNAPFAVLADVTGAPEIPPETSDTNTTIGPESDNLPAGPEPSGGLSLGVIGFDAGSTAIAPTSLERLQTLATALSRRPRLGLDVVGRYDPVSDRNALARQQMRLHIALATSAGLPGQSSQQPLNFTDSRVVGIIEEFAAKRLKAAELAAIRERHSALDAAYYEAVFEALVANEEVSQRALNNLARYRAQTIVSELSNRQILKDRLHVASVVEPTGSQDGAVTLSLGVRVQ